MIETRKLETALAPFFTRLTAFGAVSAQDRALLSAQAGAVRLLERHEALFEEGDDATHLHILSRGLALSSRRLLDGQQQHMALCLPGEALDHEGFVLERAGASACALTDACVVAVPRRALAEAQARSPALAAALTRSLAYGARLAQERVVSMGRRSAYERLAHFFCETRTRLAGAGLAAGAQFDLPLTQRDFADLLGLSVVHVNRVVQQLRREGLVEVQRTQVTVRDWRGLAQAGHFDPAYLHPCVAEV